MKVMILIPSYYTYLATLSSAFNHLGCDVFFVDWEKEMPQHYYKIHKKTCGISNKVSQLQQHYVHEWSNKLYNKRYSEIEPDLVIVYNNQKILPETLRKFKANGSRIAFLLGDHPLYSKTSQYNLEILFYSDCTISPDSGWLEDLERMGIPNLRLDFLANSPEDFFTTSVVPDNYRVKYESSILYIGRTYNNSDGYKRALFLSNFTKLGLKLFGEGKWSRWLDVFPDLKKCYNPIESRIRPIEYNYALNCCKCLPVDINSGFRNGIHMRVFEAISAGTFPLVEWTKDLEDLFGDSMLYIKNYADAGILADYVLRNEREREERCSSMKKIIRLYTPHQFVARLIDQIGLGT